MLNDFSRDFCSRILCLASGIAIVLAGSSLSRAETVDLTPSDSRHNQRVKVVFKVTGNLMSLQKSEGKPDLHPLKAVGNYVYEERVLDADTGRSLRYFEEAASDFEVDQRHRRYELREEVRWILVDPEELENMHVSPTGSLKREELDLVELPCGSNLVDLLLPKAEKSPGDSWTHDDKLLAQMFNLDAVTANDVKSQFAKIKDGVAYMTLSGNLVGTVEGVITKVEINGKYNFDIQSSTIYWVAVAIDEDREIGASTPGLHVQAAVRMVREAMTRPGHVHQETIDQFDLENVQHEAMLEHRSEAAGFSLVHNRRWHVFFEKPNMTVLRCVDDGRMIAQCNIRSLHPVGGKPLSMDKFQQDISMALGDSVRQIVDSQESQNDAGHKVLRVVAAGNVSDSPILWIYYHITHRDGRRISCAFTLGGEDAEQFGGGDMTLIGSLQFLDSDQPAEETADASEETVR